MARTCGVRIGRTDFDLVILEGSSKKPSVVACRHGRIPDDAEDPEAELTDALKAATKGLKVPGDAIGLVVDSGAAAFRSLTLPFDDAAKIEQVIKFEVESEIPQWDIDDVVVDFHATSTTGVESQLLVTAMPTEPLGAALDAATKAGLEPLEAEADTSAVVNAAWSAGVLSVDGAQLLIHVGRTSTAMVVVDGGVVRSMRAARIGSEHAGEEASRGRLLRELTRTVAGMQTANPLDVAWLCGQAFPGIAGEELEGVTVTELALFEADDLPEGTTPGHFAAAFGGALARMGGGPIAARLRRDELRFTGKLERVELPMAVFALLLAALAGIWYVVLDKELRPLEADMQKWMVTTNTFMLGDAKQGSAGRLSSPSKQLSALVESIESNPAEDPYGGMQRVKGQLQKEILNLKKRLGTNTDVRKPQSAFGAVTRVFDVLEALGREETGYYAVRDVVATYRPGRGSTQDLVEVELKMTFFASGGSGASIVATEHFDNFRNAIRDQDWCLDFPEVSSDPIDGGGGIALENIVIQVDMSVVDEEAAA